MRLVAWLSLLAACGSWDDGRPRGGQPVIQVGGVQALGDDGDHGDPDAGPIEVTVYDADNESFPGYVFPAYQATVELIAPDLSRETVLTDELGVAMANVDPGTTVVVYGGTYTLPTARVFVGVNPGDSLVVNRLRRVDFPPYCVGACQNEISFSFPPVGDEYTIYQIRVSCSRDTTDYAAVEKCANATDATAVGYAYRNVTNEVLTGATVLRHLDLATLLGTTVQMPAYDAHPTRLSAQLTDLPGGSTDVRWDTEQYFTGDTKRFTWASTTPQLEGTTQMDIAAAGDRTQFTLRFTPPGASQVVVQELASVQATTFDVNGSDMIRPIDTPSFSAANQTVSWQNASYGRAATVAKATIVGTPAAGAYQTRVVVYAPGDATSIVLPALPAAYTPVSMQTLSVELSTVEGESYNESLGLADVRPAERASDWQPDFVGRVWSTAATIGP